MDAEKNASQRDADAALAARNAAAIQRVGDAAEGAQRRVLMVEAEHPAELNLAAVPNSALTMLADADEAYVFADDKAVCIKHTLLDVINDPFSIAVATVRRVRRERAGPPRVLLVEAPPGDEAIGNIFPHGLVEGELPDADEVYVFRGDEANCVRHPEGRIFGGEVTTSIRRQPIVTHLAPDLTLTERGRTTGAHVGIPLAHAEALRDAVKIEGGTDEQQALAAEALAEIATFCAEQGR